MRSSVDLAAPARAERLTNSPVATSRSISVEEAGEVPEALVHARSSIVLIDARFSSRSGPRPAPGRSGRFAALAHGRGTLPGGEPVTCW